MKQLRGFMKSLLVNVFGPAWERGPGEVPPYALHLVFLFGRDHHPRQQQGGLAGHGLGLQAAVGDRFQMTKTGERRLENSMTGFKLNTVHLVSVRRLLESFESLGFYGAHLDSRRGLQCGQTRTGRSTTAIT
jgi:hypothetical protein